MSEARGKGPLVGIDLGTTNSLVAVLQNGAPVLIPNGINEVLTPSVVSVDASGEILVGAAALARASTHPEQTAAAFKRDMGSDRRIPLGNAQYSATELSALVLRSLREDAEAYLGHPIEEAVVTVPAYFGEAQRRATQAAGALAGLRVERIINEPTAAALAYGLHHRDREVSAVVLDLGGGTFDVTVLEITEGVIEIQSSAGDSRLGGEDFTGALANHVGERLRDAGHKLAPTLQNRARIYKAAEKVKRDLSSAQTALCVLPTLFLRSGAEIELEFSIERSEIETLWQLLLQRVRTPILTALRDARTRPEDIEEVLLVGGSTRLPCFAELCASLFGRLPRRDLPPDEGVAMGAAVQAAMKSGQDDVKDLVATDVAPFTMGIETVTELSGQFLPGAFTPIIERGTVIPVSRVKSFSTVSNRQTEILVKVFQGEHPHCADNTLLGSYGVKGIPRARAGEQAIDVRFTYDLNGVLEVETTIQQTGATTHLVVEHGDGRMSARDIEEARRAMEKLKFHPREALPNRTATERATALYVVLRGRQREELGHAIESFKAILDRQDPGEIQAAREELVAMTAWLQGT